jgi:hypothetical protein
MFFVMISSWSQPMSADWRKLSRSSKLETTADAIYVKFQDGRKQVVSVDEPTSGQIRIWSVVAGRDVVRGLTRTNIRAWVRNRLTELVGFKVNDRGQLIGEVSVPIAGLKKREWEFYVRGLARACDRFEYVLTGLDRDQEQDI